MEHEQTKARVISGLVPPEDVVAAARRSVAEGEASALKLDARTYSRAQDCVHCGLCLPACPTYRENGLEADSPRGRIALMKGLADGKVEPTESVVRHLDLCLDCRACETACPSGVVYHELIEETRARLKRPTKRTWADRVVDLAFYGVFPYAGRLKAALWPVRLLKRLGWWDRWQRSGVSARLPGKLAKLQRMAPAEGALWEKPLKRFYPSTRGDGAATRRVSFLAGCVGSVVFQELNRQTIELLQMAGCDVHVVREQGCCGALHHHGGRVKTARKMARRNIDAMLEVDGREVDAIVTNVAGCGAMLKEYDVLLRDDGGYREKAETFAKKAKDVSEYLVELAPPRPSREVAKTATYHDACHLAHGQGVAAQPRQLLNWIPGLKVVPLDESTMCCGAAGTYNVAEPEMAERLGQRKLAHVRQTGATVCVTGNAGCSMQIAMEAARAGMELEVVHPVSLLHEAYFGRR